MLAWLIKTQGWELGLQGPIPSSVHELRQVTSTPFPHRESEGSSQEAKSIN